MAYLILYTVIPPRYGKVVLNSLVHNGGFVDALRTVHARPLRGEIGRQLRHQAEASVSIIPMFVTKGTKLASRNGRH